MHHPKIPTFIVLRKSEKLSRRQIHGFYVYIWQKHLDENNSVTPESTTAKLNQELEGSNLGIPYTTFQFRVTLTETKIKK